MECSIDFFVVVEGSDWLTNWELLIFQVIYKQTSTNWVNVNDVLTFLDITDTTVTFIWASEDSGFRHLYLITSSLVQAAANGIKESMAIEHTDCINLVPSIISKVCI